MLVGSLALLEALLRAEARITHGRPFFRGSDYGRATRLDIYSLARKSSAASAACCLLHARLGNDQ